MFLVNKMKIYLDAVFLLNFCYDLLLLMTIDITLKRHMNLKRLILSSIIGGMSLAILFLPFNKIILFFMKIFISIIMVLVAFKYKNIKYTLNNLLYLYMCSVILGGFLYMLDIEFSYKREGMIFYFDKFSINYILLLIIAPIILGLYIYEHKKFKSTYNFNCKVEIVFCNDTSLICNGFIDSGNKLRDPITKKYVIIVSKKILVNYINIRSPMYVPYKSINKYGLIECFKIKYLKVNNRIFTNYLVGISNDEFNLNGCDCLLNYKILEDICLEK